MAAVLDQKAVFQERLSRISSGKQFEHPDVIGKATQLAYEKRFGDKFQQMRTKRRKRTFLDKVMIVVAFLSGMIAVFAGRLIYFKLSQIEGLPESFYALGSRGMLLCALIVALLLAAMLHLSTRARMPALVLGCIFMHYSEAAVASNAPGLWAQMFSPDYAAAMTEEGRDYRISYN